MPCFLLGLLLLQRHHQLRLMLLGVLQFAAVKSVCCSQQQLKAHRAHSGMRSHAIETESMPHVCMRG